MYILLEGMPVTGKTTIAKELQKSLQAKYIKSVLSDTLFGNSLKKIRNTKEKDKLELLILSDLALDELRVKKALDIGSVVRDKALTATLGHLKVHNYENRNKKVIESLLIGYQQLKELIVQPNIAVYLKPNKKKIFEHLADKKDISNADKYLLDNFELYEKQSVAIEKYMREIYKENLLVIECFSGTIKEMTDYILKKVREYGE